MARIVFNYDHPAPPTAEDLDAAAQAGAAEVVSGIPPALAALGIETYGRHEIADPAPPAVPAEVDLWRVRVILAEDGLVGAIDAAVAALPDTPENRGVQQRWLGPALPPKFVRNSPLVLGMIAMLGPTLGLTDDYADDVCIRAAALPE